jgi:hypothetical protein
MKNRKEVYLHEVLSIIRLLPLCLVQMNLLLSVIPKHYHISVSDRFSHLYKTVGNIIVLYILMFMFLGVLCALA